MNRLLLPEAMPNSPLIEPTTNTRNASGPTRLHHLFEARVAEAPEAIALSFAGGRMTYEELNARADDWAGALRSAGVGPEVLVGLCVERSCEMIVGILAILKAGGAYVPLEPSSPPERLAMLLEDARPAVLLTQEELLPRLPKGEARVFCVDAPPDAASRSESGSVEGGALPSGDDLAYVIYTSGSTGRPKGVLVTHGNVVRLFSATRPWFQFDERDVWTLFHSFAFDFSVWEIFGALLHGGRLVIVPHAVSRSPQAFYELLARERVTVLNQTPSAFRLLMQAEGSLPVPSSLALRFVIFGGEALEPRMLKPWFAQHGSGRPQLINMYGITETTVHVTYRPMAEADVARPSVIGVPIPDLQLHLLDGGLQPVSTGEVGELCVGGAGVARGYLNCPELTAQKFIPDPFSPKPGARLYRSGDLARRLPDGELEYLGRADLQVKIRGHRVELGEIEAALDSHPAINKSVVRLREDAPGGQRLVGYLVSRPGELPGASELQAFLAQKVPAYMIPASFVWLPMFPLTVNGKLDRQALPAPGSQRPDLDQPYAGPRTALERYLASLWCSVLNLERVGIHDKFFELGGHSIQAAEFIAQLDRKLEEKIFVVALFEAPTIAGFADFLRRHYPGPVARLFGGGLETRAAAASARVDAKMIAHARELIKPLTAGINGAYSGAHHQEILRAEGTFEGKNPRALFILAPPRSGTSLLRVMLAGHPGLFAVSELHLLEFSDLAQRQAFFSGKYSLWLEGALRMLMELKRCSAEEALRLMTDWERQRLPTRAFYRQVQDWIGERTLVEKTPSYGLHPELLNRMEADFDGALYIHLVRHPQAMVCSFEENHLNQVYFTCEHPFSSRQVGELFWTMLNQNVLHFLREIPLHRQFRIRFEDLVTRPEAVMRELCQRLGLDFHPDMVRPYKNAERKMLDGIHANSKSMTDHKFRVHGEINSEAARRHLLAEAEDTLGEVTWELAKLFGYGAKDSSARETVANGAARGVRTDRFAARREMRQAHRRDALHEEPVQQHLPGVLEP